MVQRCEVSLIVDELTETVLLAVPVRRAFEMHSVPDLAALGLQSLPRSAREIRIDDVAVRADPAPVEMNFRKGMIDIRRAGIDQAREDSRVDVVEVLARRDLRSAKQRDDQRRLRVAVADASLQHFTSSNFVEGTLPAEQNLVANEIMDPDCLLDVGHFV